MWPWSAERVRGAAGARFAGAAETDAGRPRRSIAHETEVTGAVSDSRLVYPGCLFVAIRGERFDGHSFVRKALESGAALALVESSWGGIADLDPGQKERCLVCEDVTASFRALAGALRREFTFPVIGVGGSNGKTTTKEMLAALLSGGERRVTRTEKSENGFLGVAITLSQRNNGRVSPPDALVLEIGIDAVGAMREHVELSTPDVVTLTALGPEHLAGLGTWENAVREEFELFLRGAPRVRVWQLEDVKLRERIAHLGAGPSTEVLVGRAETFASLEATPAFRVAGGPARAFSRLEYRLEAEGARETRVSVTWRRGDGRGAAVFAEDFDGEFLVPLPGKHNAANFALACASALATGASATGLSMGWETFVPPAMRSRVAPLGDGVTLYDDCYNASPSSMDAALEALTNPQWAGLEKALILGDMLDLGEESRKWHLVLAERLSALQGVSLCLYGDAMYDVYQRLNEKMLSQKNFATLKWLPAEADPCVWVQEVLAPLRSALVLVKGSRGMKLDRVVRALEALKSPA